MTSVKTLSPSVLLRAVDRVAKWAEQKEKEPLASEEVQQVFYALYAYTEHLIQSPAFSEESVKEGVHSLLSLALEAASRLERIQGKGVVTGLKVFQDLKNLYHHKVLPLFSKKHDAELKMGLTFKSHGDGVLEGLESVKEDRDYELFLIRKEDSSSYVTPAMRSHILLLDRVNALFSEENSLVVRASIAYDRLCHDVARKILKEKMGLVDLFYKEAFKFKHHDFIKSVNKAVMALMLCGNARNLKSNTTGKSCCDYYHDFHLYLRQACEASVKKREGRLDHFLHHVIHLKEELLLALFLIDLPRPDLGMKPVEAHSIALMVEKQREWILSLLEKISCGPLDKASHYCQSKKVGFDPLVSRSPLGQLYCFEHASREVSVLNLPSPTYQETINEAVLTAEFVCFEQQLLSQGKTHLLINLQPRNSWKEHARAACLERAHNGKSLLVVSFDRHTAFYEQNGPYLECRDADAFLEICQEQMFTDGSGFFIPPSLQHLREEVGKLCCKIHNSYFKAKKQLTQKERRDFIEILQWFFVLHLVETCQVDSLSFTDKDGIDSAASLSTALWAITHKKGLSNDGALELFYLLYLPSLACRGRAPFACFVERVHDALLYFADKERVH